MLTVGLLLVLGKAGLECVDHVLQGHGLDLLHWNTSRESEFISPTTRSFRNTKRLKKALMILILQHAGSL